MDIKSENNETKADIDIVTIFKILFRNYINISFITTLFLILGIFITYVFPFQYTSKMSISINDNLDIFENHNAFIESISMRNVSNANQLYLDISTIYSDDANINFEYIKKTIKALLNKNLTLNRYLDDTSIEPEGDKKKLIINLTESMSFEFENDTLEIYLSSIDPIVDKKISQAIYSGLNHDLVSDIKNQINFIRSLITYRTTNQIEQKKIIIAAEEKLYLNANQIAIQNLEDQMSIAKSLNIVGSDINSLESEIRIYIENNVPDYMRGYTNLAAEIRSLKERNNDISKYSEKIGQLETEIYALKNILDLSLTRLDDSLNMTELEKFDFIVTRNDLDLEYTYSPSKTLLVMAITFMGFVFSSLFYLIRQYED